MPTDQIAKMIGISKPTLYAHYADELKTGMAELGYRVGQRLLQIAFQDDDRRAALAATIFLAKTKFGYREKDRPDDVKEIDGNGQEIDNNKVILEIVSVKHADKDADT